MLVPLPDTILPLDNIKKQVTVDNNEIQRFVMPLKTDKSGCQEHKNESKIISQ